MSHPSNSPIAEPAEAYPSTYGGVDTHGNNNNATTIEVHDETNKQSYDLAASTSTGSEELDKPLIPATAERSHVVNALLLILLIGLGMVEGAGFQRSGILLPEAISGQMTFKVWIILKMFITSAGASMIFQGILSLVLPADFHRSRFYRTKRAGIPRVVLGAGALGVGMALSGGGPTMVPAQIGAGVHNSWAVFLGMLAGGLIFAVIDKIAPNVFAPPEEEEEFTVDKKFPRFRYQFVSIPLGLVLVGASIALEFIVTQKKDEERLGKGELPWFPTIAGAIVGLMQVPIRLIAGHGQGGSTSIMTLIGTATCGVLAPKNRVTGFQQLWQPAFVWAGTLLGALASTQINDFDSPVGFSIWRSIVGGFLMIFGARVASGCTCGHGISGFAELSFESVVAACAIFGAGIATGFIIEAAGGSTCCGQAQ